MAAEMTSASRLMAGSSEPWPLAASVNHPSLEHMERAFIESLRGRVPRHRLLPLGIGDDAALLNLSAHQAVVTTDIITDQVDFRLGECDPRQIGRKALAVNLSDLAAMAAVPRGAVVGLVLPRNDGLKLAKELYEGLLPLAEQFDLALAGGDTNSWDGPLVVSVTAIGAPTSRGVLRRDGARSGDRIVVTGSFGGSILGHHFDFTPRVKEALLLNEQYELRAGLDCSDGLSLDVSRLAAASGCGACLDLNAIPIAPAAHKLAAQQPGSSSALDHALADGEDFELILALSPSECERLIADQPLEVPVTRIGEFIDTPGLWQRDAAGKITPLTPRGFEHK